MLASRPPVLISPPAATPIALADVKSNLKVDHSDEDTSILLAIEAATAQVEKELGRKLVTQTWRHDFADWNGGELRLAMPSATNVSISYTDTAGSAQTLASTEYQVADDNRASFIIPAAGKVWPPLANVVTAVRVTATHGFGNAAAVPSDIKQALMLMVGDWYAIKQTAIYGVNIKSVPMHGTVERLLAEYRCTWMVA